MSKLLELLCWTLGTVHITNTHTLCPGNIAGKEVESNNQIREKNSDLTFSFLCLRPRVHICEER